VVNAVVFGGEKRATCFRLSTGTTYLKTVALMSMQTRPIVLHFSIGFVLFLSGCIFLPSFMHSGYGGKVVAHITPRTVESIDAAVLALGDFEGPRKIE